MSTFDIFQKKQIKVFQKYIMDKPDGFCCICLTLLYPEEQYYRSFQEPENLPCIEWKDLQPLANPTEESQKMVCKRHLKGDEFEFYRMNYPGKDKRLIFIHF